MENVKPSFISRSSMFCFGKLCLVPVLFSAVINFTDDHLKGEYITVNGKKMAYQSFGLKDRKQGDPVLIFESGLGMGAGNFEPMLTILAKSKAAAIAYDRNGIGESEADTTLITDKDVAMRLHLFLQTFKVEPPYILAGHSLGGPFIRMFASLYPKEIAGLMFIDPTDFMLTHDEDEQVKKTSASATGYRELWVTLLEKMANDANMPAGVRSEVKRVKAVSEGGFFKEFNALAPLPDIPVTVLIAYNRRVEQQELTLSNELKINHKEWLKELDYLRVKHYAEMIESNKSSSIVLLPELSHGIHNQDPELVADQILKLYKRCAMK